MNEIIRLENIVKKYVTKAGELPVLTEVDLRVKEGEFLCIVGHSGSGKSTLLHLVGLLDRPTSGKIFFEGNDVSKMPQARLDALRNTGFGFVFQFYHLLPELTALENALLPVMARCGFFGWFARGAGYKKRSREMLALFGLQERLTHRPSELSGGEQQRVAIARALAGNPRVLLADEPTGNLDEATGKGIVDILVKLNKRDGQTIVMVTHDRDLAAKADRILELREHVLHPVE